jgi:hypothetical protein
MIAVILGGQPSSKIRKRSGKGSGLVAFLVQAPRPCSTAWWTCHRRPAGQAARHRAIKGPACCPLSPRSASHPLPPRTRPESIAELSTIAREFEPLYCRSAVGPFTVAIDTGVTLCEAFGITAAADLGRSTGIMERTGLVPTSCESVRMSRGTVGRLGRRCSPAPGSATWRTASSTGFSFRWGTCPFRRRNGTSGANRSCAAPSTTRSASSRSASCSVNAQGGVAQTLEVRPRRLVVG